MSEAIPQRLKDEADVLEDAYWAQDANDGPTHLVLAAALHSAEQRARDEERLRHQWKPISELPSEVNVFIGLIRSSYWDHGLAEIVRGSKAGSNVFYDMDAMMNCNYTRLHPTHWLEHPTYPADLPAPANMEFATELEDRIDELEKELAAVCNQTATEEGQ